MSFSLVDAAGANFRTDEQSDDLNTTFMRRLGVKTRYLPARLAIARSLAVESPPPLLSSDADPGKTIKGDALFGTGASLLCWLALIVEHVGETIDKRRMIGLVAAHWRRGLGLLDTDWKQADEDPDKFVRRLVEVAGLPVSGSGGRPGTPPGARSFSDGRIAVPVGEIAQDAASGEEIRWDVNGPGGSPHCALMGGVGSGKTRTAAAILRNIRGRAVDVPLIAFDFKGDLADDYQMDKVFGAATLEPPRQPVPLNVLALRGRADIDIAEAASRFRDSFSRLKATRVGDRQRDAIHAAAEHALARHHPCTLQHILDELGTVYADRDMKEDGAISTMREICRFPLFVPDHDPAEFFGRSWLVKMPPNVADDSRTIVVNLILDALDRYLNSLIDAKMTEDGSRGLRIVCMVDEAHRILGGKLPSLSNLIRMSRSKGGAIMLIAQTPDDFSGEDDDFLSEMGLVAAFSTNAPPRHAGRILGRGAKLASLQAGECFVKLRNDPVTRKIKAW